MAGCHLDLTPRSSALARAPGLRYASRVRAFNIAGPCDPARHYTLPPERRLPACAELVDQQAYFVVHAPRQTGKTTLMKALAHRLTAEGRYAALYFTCEEARVFSDDIGAAERVIWSAIRDAARDQLPEELRPRS